MKKQISKLIIQKKFIDVSKDEFVVENGEEKIISDILSKKKKKQKSFDNSISIIGDDLDLNSEFDEEEDTKEKKKVEDIKEKKEEKVEEEKESNTANVEISNENVVDSTLETISIDEIPEQDIDVQEQEPPEENIEEIVEQKPAKPEYDFSSLVKTEYDKGFEAGKKSAIKIMENEFKKKLFSGVKGLFTLTENIRKEFNDYKINLDNHIITLALAIASKIIKKEISIDNEMVISHVKEAINKIIGVDSLIIYINPNDEEILRNYKNEIIDKFDSIKDLSIQVNEKIEVGGCKIESRLGNVDARIETQLSVIEEALRENVRNNNNETKTENRE
jgi:flagellar assembly protein FliH